MSLPLLVRNRLAELILAALDEPAARAALEAVAAVTPDGRTPGRARAWPGFAADVLEEGASGAVVLKAGWRPHAAEIGERAHRAFEAMAGRRPAARRASFRLALQDAALLFDAGLYFETHERLEPHWRRARGETRQTLKRLIQVAVGFQHLANGNVAGAASLLAAGAALDGRRLAGHDLSRFAAAVSGCRGQVLGLGAEAPRRFEWATVPRFPVGAA